MEPLLFISKDGKYLYASNRGHDSIAVYTILADGSLELLEIVPTHGQTPRDFDLTPDQNFSLLSIKTLTMQLSLNVIVTMVV